MPTDPAHRPSPAAPLRDRMSNSADAIIKQSAKGWSTSKPPAADDHKKQPSAITSPLRIAKRESGTGLGAPPPGKVVGGRPPMPVVARRSSSSYKHLRTNNLVSKSPFKSQIPTPTPHPPNPDPDSDPAPTPSLPSTSSANAHPNAARGPRRGPTPRKTSGEKRPRPASMHEQAESENARPPQLKRERRQSKAYQGLIAKEHVSKSPFRARAPGGAQDGRRIVSDEDGARADAEEGEGAGMEEGAGARPPAPPPKDVPPGKLLFPTSGSGQGYSPSPSPSPMPGQSSRAGTPTRSSLVSKRLHGPRTADAPHGEGRRQRRKTVTFDERCDVLEFEAEEAEEDPFYDSEADEDRRYGVPEHDDGDGEQFIHSDNMEDDEDEDAFFGDGAEQDQDVQMEAFVAAAAAAGPDADVDGEYHDEHQGEEEFEEEHQDDEHQHQEEQEDGDEEERGAQDDEDHHHDQHEDNFEEEDMDHAVNDSITGMVDAMIANASAFSPAHHDAPAQSTPDRTLAGADVHANADADPDADVDAGVGGGSPSTPPHGSSALPPDADAEDGVPHGRTHRSARKRLQRSNAGKGAVGAGARGESSPAASGAVGAAGFAFPSAGAGAEFATPPVHTDKDGEMEVEVEVEVDGEMERDVGMLPPSPSPLGKHRELPRGEEGEEGDGGMEGLVPRFGLPRASDGSGAEDPFGGAGEKEHEDEREHDHIPDTSMMELEDLLPPPRIRAGDDSILSASSGGGGSPRGSLLGRRSRDEQEDRGVGTAHADEVSFNSAASLPPGTPASAFSPSQSASSVGGGAGAGSGMAIGRDRIVSPSGVAIRRFSGSSSPLHNLPSRRKDKEKEGSGSPAVGSNSHVANVNANVNVNNNINRPSAAGGSPTVPVAAFRGSWNGSGSGSGSKRPELTLPPLPMPSPAFARSGSPMTMVHGGSPLAESVANAFDASGSGSVSGSRSGSVYGSGAGSGAGSGEGPGWGEGSVSGRARTSSGGSVNGRPRITREDVQRRLMHRRSVESPGLEGGGDAFGRIKGVRGEGDGEGDGEGEGEGRMQVDGEEEPRQEAQVQGSKHTRMSIVSDADMSAVFATIGHAQKTHLASSLSAGGGHAMDRALNASHCGAVSVDAATAQSSARMPDPTPVPRPHSSLGVPFGGDAERPRRDSVQLGDIKSALDRLMENVVVQQQQKGLGGGSSPAGPSPRVTPLKNKGKGKERDQDRGPGHMRVESVTQGIKAGRFSLDGDAEMDVEGEDVQDGEEDEDEDEEMDTDADVSRTRSRSLSRSKSRSHSRSRSRSVVSPPPPQQQLSSSIGQGQGQSPYRAAHQRAATDSLVYQAPSFASPEASQGNSRAQSPVLSPSASDEAYRFSFSGSVSSSAFALGQRPLSALGVSSPGTPQTKDARKRREQLILEKRRAARQKEEDESLGYYTPPHPSDAFSPENENSARRTSAGRRRTMSQGAVSEASFAHGYAGGGGGGGREEEMRLGELGMVIKSGEKSGGLAGTITRELRKLDGFGDRKGYRIREHEAIIASSDAKEEFPHITLAGDLGSSKVWRPVRRPSDMNEYSKQIKEYRAQEKPGKAHGKVFVRVLGVRHIKVPFPREPTTITCTLNNGIHYVTTPESTLAKDTRIDQEFELIEHNKLEFTLTIKVRRDPHIVAQHKALAPPAPPAPVRQQPAPASKSRGVFGGLFSSTPKKSAAANAAMRAAQQQVLPPVPTRMPENLARYLKADGTLARAFIAFKDIAPRCDTRLFEISYPLIGQRLEQNGGPSTLELGEICLQVFRLPPLPGVPPDQLPQSLEECVRGLRHIQWHKVTYFEGTLTQHGGDCTTWRRRQLRVIGANLVAFNDVTKKATATINLKKAVAVEDMQDMRGKLDDEDYGLYGVERSFRLTFPNDQHIFFFADSDEEKARWLDVLRALVGHIPPNPLWAELLYQRQQEMAKQQQQPSQENVAGPSSRPQ